MLPIPCSPPLFAPIFPIQLLRLNPSRLDQSILPGPRLPTASFTACTRARQHLQFLVYTFLSRTFFGSFWHNQYYWRAWGTRKMERACIYHRFREVYVSYVSRNQLQPSQETGCIYGKSSCISAMVLRPQPAATPDLI